MTVEHTDANIQRLVETELATVKPERILEDWKMRRLNELRSDAAPLHGIVRRPPAICCTALFVVLSRFVAPDAGRSSNW